MLSGVDMKTNVDKESDGSEAVQCVTEGALRVKSCSLFAFADQDPGSFCGGSPWVQVSE